jgi:hypothetical protein
MLSSVDDHQTLNAWRRIHLGAKRQTHPRAMRSPVDGNLSARHVLVSFVFSTFALFLAAMTGSSLAGPPAFREVQGHHVANLEVPREGHAGFTLMLPAVTGIQFTNLVPESRSLTNHILLNGSGVAAGDVDGDGRCDLFFCGIGGKSTLYRNLGDWKFQDITRAAGLELPNLDATGTVLADVDGDGDLDLLVTSIRQGVHLFLNDGQGHFQEATKAAGLTSITAGMSMALADVNGGGKLDLYVCNYRNETLRDGFRMQVRVATINGKRVITMLNGRPLTGPDLTGWVTLAENGQIVENGQADVLYRNDFPMLGRGRRDVDDVDSRIIHQLPPIAGGAPEAQLAGGCGRRALVDLRDQFQHRRGRKIEDGADLPIGDRMRAAHEPGADQADADLAH